MWQLILRLEAGAEVHMENDWYAVRVCSHLHRLRWPTIRPVQAYLEGLQPHMLVVASGEREQASTSSSPCFWKAALISAVALFDTPFCRPPVFLPSAI